MKILKDLAVSGQITVGQLLQSSIDTDKFLVAENGVVKFRTGSEILSDIGAPSTSGTGATGTWGISISGNSATTSQTNFSALTINSAAVATQSWVQSQGYLTSVSDVWVNTSGDTMTGALNIDYANAYLYIKSANSGSGVQWHDQIWLGRYDRVQTASQYPNYLPGAAYGLHITQSSDAVFFGLISRGANSNDYNAVIAWGDDVGDILQFRFNNGVVASLTDAGTFNATNITLNSAQVATQSWVTSQGYLTAGSYLPLSGGTLTGALTITTSNDGALTLRVPSGDSNQWNYINFTGTDNVRDAYIGTDSSGTPQWYRDDNGVNITLGSTVNINGNIALHAGNYNSYSPTLTGVGASGTWGIRITGFANQGTARLYSTDSTYNYDSANPYFGYLTYDGTRWLFQVSPGTPASVRVAYSDTSGNSDTVDGLHADSFMRDLGFGAGYPSWDANTFAENRSGFTYSNNAPLTGALVYFGAAGYGIQLNGNYNGDDFSIRSRNGDAGSWRPWKRILTDYNYSSYALPLSGGTLTGRLTVNASGDYAVLGSSSQRYIMQVRNTSNSVNSAYGWWWFHNTNGDTGFHADGIGDILTLTRGGVVGVNTADFTYTANDNTRTVGSNTNNKLFVNGSIQLLSNNDAIVIGRGTATFLTDEELGFGWGGGWYMTESSYIRSRGSKSLHMNGGSVDYVGSMYIEGSGTYAHLQPNSGAYGSLQITNAKGGWSGIRFTASGVNIMANNNEVGFYNNAAGWQLLWSAGTGYIYKGGTGAGTQATILDSSNYTSWAPSLGGSGASGTWSINISGNAASASSVSWSNVSSKPASWLNEPNLIYDNVPNTAAPSGFWQSYLGAGNPTGTWFNYINVRHSNTGNVHGYQLGMSYYDNNLWFRSYEGQGTYRSWALALSTQNYNSYTPTLTGTGASGTWGISITGNADTVDGYHATNAANGLAYYASNGYLYVPSWINIGTTGIFSTTNNAHIRPNQSGTYGAWEMIGSRNSWSGIWFNDSGNTLMMNNNESGHYMNGYGWQFRWYQGTMYVSRGTYGGGAEYNVLDSGNYTSYALTNTWNTTQSANSLYATAGSWTGYDTSTNYWDDVLRSEGGARYTVLEGRNSDTSSAYIEYTVPSGARMLHISTLPWSNTGYFDVYGVRSDGTVLWMKRVNDFNDVQNTSNGVLHSGSRMFKVEGVDRFVRIRIQARKGRIHLQGLGWTNERGGGDSFNGFIHIDNIYSPNTIITSANIGSQSVSYASSAGNADTVDGYHMNQALLTSSSPSFNRVTTGSFKIGDNYGVRYFSFNNDNNCNQKAKIYFNSWFWGNIEVEATTSYNYANRPGVVRVRYYLGLNPYGGVYANERKVLENGGPTGDGITFGDVTWDSSNSLWFIPVVGRDCAANAYTIKVTAYVADGGSLSHVMDTMYITARYTDTTAYSYPYEYYNRYVGFGGKTDPSYAVDASGGIRASSDLLGNDVYTTGGWFRNHTNNNGIYWSATAWHVYPKNVNDMYMRSGANESSLNFLRSDGTSIGYVHFASSFDCGFLTSGRSWRLRIEDTGRMQAYGPIARSAHASGFLEGSYNNVGGNSTNTNPIYTIGSSYNPTDSSLSNMYGIGYSHPNFWGSGKTSSWGMYVCEAGTINATIGAGAVTIWAQNDIVAYSDIRVKDNIEVVENAIEKIQAIRGVTFTRKDANGKDRDKRHAGVIAQEVLNVLPEVVTGTEEDMYSVAYGNMAALFIEAIKEQQQQIEELKNKLNAVTK